MTKLTKIYTRTGDDGTTGLARGPRRKKFDLRINAYGSVDEANSQIGKIRVLSKDMLKIDNMLFRVQNDMFDLGSDLAAPGKDEGVKKVLRITRHQVSWLESQIDYYNGSLEPLKSFILPGGGALGAEFHMGRTIVRRAERLVAELIDIEPYTNPFTIHYLNRLSDLFFVMARVANNNGASNDASDVLWSPGRFRGE